MESVNTNEQLFRDCVHLVYEHRLRSLLSVFAISFLPLVMGWPEKTRIVTVCFVVALWIFTFVNLHVSRRVCSTRLDHDSAVHWSLFFHVQLVIVALLYDGVFIYLDANHVEGARTLLVLIAAGFSAGGVAAYHHLKWSVPMFTGVSLFPQIIYSLLYPDNLSYLLAAGMVIYFVFMSIVSLELHANTTHSLMIGYELAAAKEQAEQQALTDTLTALQNRRGFFETAPHLLANARRHARPISLVMLDIDHFKRINDEYGHAAGDRALRLVADRLKNVVRESDVVARLGGEEFAILLPDTAVRGAIDIAERLRSEMQLIDLSFAGKTSPITGSFGVAESDGDFNSLERLLDRADQALYLAKNRGRNRTETLDTPPSLPRA